MNGVVMGDAGVESSGMPLIEVEVASRTTFAAAQNAVPLIRRIVLRGTGDRAMVDLRLVMTAQPGFCRAKEWQIDRLGMGAELEVGDRQVTLDYGVLDRLNEAEHGQLVFRLLDGEAVLAECVAPIELLARDEWGGSAEMAQVLAAFVSPNHPAVSVILKEASRVLEASGQSGALDGYQGRDPRRVHMLAEAIWTVISAKELSYAQPPRSFEREGQKIRDPGCVWSTGLATCLDSTLLLCAALEAVRINPVVVFTRGHAFVGFWLVDKTFPMTIEPDVSEVRKAVAARELVVLESTLLTNRPRVGFRQAKANAEGQLAEDAERAFHMAIDIGRARAAGIRPISSARVEGEAAAGSAGEEGYELLAPAQIAPPLLEEMPVEFVEELRASPTERLDRWQRKLLDLSLRNRLLNFSDTKQTLGLLCADVAALEDALASGKKFRVISLKDENPIGDRDPRLYKQQTGKDIQQEFAATVFDKGQVCAVEGGKEMASRLTTLYRAARSDLAEGGTNTLFMAVGFLRWKKDAKDERWYRAPLLLLPVKLGRRSASSGYDLSQHEDDVVFNQTLLEFLERDFGLSIPALRGELPRDDAGLDIKRILGIVRHAVRESPGFEVAEDVALSTFSFAKYLMWKDLVDRTDSLRNNRLVRHLLDNPAERFRDGTDGFPDVRTIDERVDPATLYTPLAADSSQLAAVIGAAAGKDFVIIGPPGTGKSQTIANIIAHCLAHGKTVLFVAEKSAALDVVHRRLKGYGLADACLELHSNKSDRKSVLAQLGAAWDRAEGSRADEWVRLTAGLKIRREELNEYVADLHRPGSHGFSVFYAIGVLIGKTPQFGLSFAGLEAHDAESFASLESLAERLVLTHRAVEGCGSFDEVERTDWSFGWQGELLAAAARLREGAVTLRASCQRMDALLGFATDERVRNGRVTALVRLAKAVQAVSPSDLGLAAREDLGVLEAALAELGGQAEAYRRGRAALSADFTDEQALRMPLDDLDAAWRRESVRVWPLSALGKRRVRKLLQTYAQGGEASPATDLPGLLALREALRGVSGSAARVLPGFAGVTTDVAAVRAAVRHAMELRAAAAEVLRVSGGGIGLAACLERITRGAGDFVAAAEDLHEAKRRFDEVGRAYQAVSGGAIQDSSLSGLVDRLEGLRRDADRLNDWVKWVQVRGEAGARGLAPMIAALRDDGRAITDARAEFRVAYFAWWLPGAIDRCPRLRGFVHWEHEDRIAKFKVLIEAVQRLTAAQVRRALTHDLPARDGVPRKSELGILRHQLGLQRPSESIRGLIAGMPETFTKLTPCVLMSPLSVAQYLPAEHAGFDMVIMDEASQITTWDAVGAIARGRQSIIVGDPKQLPPTNFFGKSSEEEDEELALHERDLLSILDEASAAGLPLHQLNWHYRSRDEGLIAFSNHHYYGQRLVTFPSPSTGSDAVRFHKVAGVYARGSGRTNEIEARAVTAFVIERLEEWAKRPEDERPSIGVITFNAPQQELILDLLDAERRVRPHLEWFFSDDRHEPVIVKNLENVQGDERDVMVFSITFGRDSAGRMTMDFGAVNREGGEKRLNVAVTRAKSEFHVFSSISADEIDTGRAGGTGVLHLKNYLDYAERGAVALPSMDAGSMGPAENPFEESVAAGLRARGWEVRTQIGVSGFRIDLGIVHPDRAGVYLAGVECDGATYHRSATARDRDQIREGVLRNLGWEILRVWSTDWFMRPGPALDRIDLALKGLLEESRGRAGASSDPS